jgi:hypothetical protein
MAAQMAAQMVDCLVGLKAHVMAEMKVVWTVEMMAVLMVGL